VLPPSFIKFRKKMEGQAKIESCFFNSTQLVYFNEVPGEFHFFDSLQITKDTSEDGMKAALIYKEVSCTLTLLLRKISPTSTQHTRKFTCLRSLRLTSKSKSGKARQRSTHSRFLSSKPSRKAPSRDTIVECGPPSLRGREPTTGSKGAGTRGWGSTFRICPTRLTASRSEDANSRIQCIVNSTTQTR